MLVLKILLITLAVIVGLLIFLLSLRAKVTIDYREELASPSRCWESPSAFSPPGRKK